MANMKCPICDSVGEFKNVDEFRLTQAGMSMCPSCGFISYPNIVNAQSQLKDFYREEYRSAPTEHNLYTGERKLQYHLHFLKDLITEWRNKSPDVLEIGAAFGMFLGWFKANVPSASVSGTELTPAMRDNATEEFGVVLDEDFDDSKQWDLIATYKVLEHQPHPNLELKRYAKCLKPGGYLYIGVPTWFNRMHNFGLSGFNLEYYYHKNHINVWSLEHFEHLLAKSGFKIVKEDHIMYDDVYLCQYDPGVPIPERKFSPEKTLSDLGKVRKAWDFFFDNKFKDAFETWPDFPEAYRNHYEVNRQPLHQEGWDYIWSNVLKPAMENCKYDVKATFFAAEVAMRYEQFEIVQMLCKKILEGGLSPNHPNTLKLLSHVYRQLSERVEKAEDRLKLRLESRKVMRVLREISSQDRDEAIRWIFLDNAFIGALRRVMQKVTK